MQDMIISQLLPFEWNYEQRNGLLIQDIMISQLFNVIEIKGFSLYEQIIAQIYVSIRRVLKFVVPKILKYIINDLHMYLTWHCIIWACTCMYIV